MKVVSNEAGRYNYMSRRVAKATATEARSFLYDGWNPIREVALAGGVLSTNFYVWGPDLSGTLQGAGGVGGLIAVVRDGVPYFAAYDANGNVTEYVAQNGTVVAHYEYDPFGNTTAATGAMAGEFAHRFSTKYWDAETGLYYYGYRFYSPGLGRWLSRDPIEERGGISVLGTFANDALNTVDVLGLRITIDAPDPRSFAEAELRAEKDGTGSACIKSLMLTWNRHLQSLILGLGKGGASGTKLLRDMYLEIKNSPDYHIIFQLAVLGDKGESEVRPFRLRQTNTIRVKLDMPIPNRCCMYTHEQIETWNTMGPTIAHELGHVYSAVWARGLSQSWWTRFRIAWKTFPKNYPSFSSDLWDDVYPPIADLRRTFGNHVPDFSDELLAPNGTSLQQAFGFGLWGVPTKGSPPELQPYAQPAARGRLP